MEYEIDWGKVRDWAKYSKSAYYTGVAIVFIVLSVVCLYYHFTH